MTEEIKRGGKRAGAGRKAITNKKKPVTVYVEELVIQDKGGEDAVKEIMIASVASTNKTIPIEQWEDIQKKLNEKVVNKIESDFVEEGKALAEMTNEKGTTTTKGIAAPKKEVKSTTLTPYQEMLKKKRGF